MTALAAPCLFFLVAILKAHPKAAVMVAVLYLPLPRTWTDYDYFREWIEDKHPKKTMALVHEDEKMLGKAEWTPVHFLNMRAYLIPKARNLRLVKAAS